MESSSIGVEWAFSCTRPSGQGDHPWRSNSIRISELGKQRSNPSAFLVSARWCHNLPPDSDTEVRCRPPRADLFGVGSH